MKRRAFKASHIPLSDLTGFLFAVLNMVNQGAAPDAAGRCAGRIFEGKAAQVRALLSGLPAGQPEGVAERMGCSVEDLRNLCAPELAGLHLAGWPT